MGDRIMPAYDKARDRILKLIQDGKSDKNQPREAHIYVDNIDKVVNIIVPTGCQSISINLNVNKT